MNNTIKIYIVLLLLIFLGIAYVESIRPMPIDWQPYYTTDKKSPYGLYVLDKELKKLMNGAYIEKLNETPYEFFRNQFDFDTSVNNYTIRGTYFSIDGGNELDAESVNEILTFVSYGNEAFISTSNFHPTLMDSLGFKTNFEYYVKDTVDLSLEYLDSKIYHFSKLNYVTYFDSVDTAKFGVLGYIRPRDSTAKKVNFIRAAFGNGYVYLHSTPVAFTNYHLLKSNHHRYAASVLSYIQPDHSVLWDTHKYNRDNKAQTPLRVILSYPSLRWAWYFLLIGFILYLIFNAKRRQRIVPIIEPLQNTTVDFTKTISNLYYQENDFKNIFEKKIIYFLERIRSSYYLDTQILDDKFIQKLAVKSGKDKALIKRIVTKINQRRKNRYFAEADLIELNNWIEEFWGR